jgi:hypothetical protein
MVKGSLENLKAMSHDGRHTHLRVAATFNLPVHIIALAVVFMIIVDRQADPITSICTEGRQCRVNWSTRGNTSNALVPT